MEREALGYILIQFHAILGAVALIAGAVAVAVQKGSRVHKKSGTVFYYTMLSSALLALVISFLPGHESYFLFTVGLFSSYFLLSGYRSLRFKRFQPESFDKALPILLVIVGVFMIFAPFFIEGVINIVMLSFGIFAVLFGVRDFNTIRKTKKVRKVWLRMHLGNMVGGYISSITAFFVVNNILPGVWNWFIPGLIGGVYIAYWNKKLGRLHSKQKEAIS